ncbi:hypothetical protein ACLESO_58580, partial [Pyxidicoccus sp. 3LG]
QPTPEARPLPPERAARPVAPPAPAPSRISIEIGRVEIRSKEPARKPPAPRPAARGPRPHGIEPGLGLGLGAGFGRRW